ncbi:MarR family transcriptional regulator [Dactylosporangium sp. NPDC049742]|uniref:MarR family winged helix-turn-helix transcriptional regulator n=1 Tax=Dactylosporangium sp. NPDC049742 TaxID=3154737 RepID=UPI0034287707
MNDLDLADQLLGCVTQIRRVLDTRLQQHGVSVARKRVLGALAAGPSRQSELATALDVAPRTITELIDGLSRDGLVQRTDDPRDRRARLVRLTPAGERANALATATRHEFLAELFADLTPEERAALAHTLATLRTRATALT